MPATTVEPKAARTEARPAHTRDLPAAAESAQKAVEKAMPAAERLALSRNELREAMMAIAYPAPKPSVLGPGVENVVKSLMDKALDLPGADIVLKSMERWWKDHPLRTAGVVAGEASRRLVQPALERNPQGFLLGALALGGLFVLTKPWRWLLRPALFMGLMPQLISQALKHMPLDTVLRMAGASLKKKSASSWNRRSAARTAAAATSGVDARSSRP